MSQPKKRRLRQVAHITPSPCPPAAPDTTGAVIPADAGLCARNA
jgi:hypothetical protein